MLQYVLAVLHVLQVLLLLELHHVVQVRGRGSGRVVARPHGRSSRPGSLGRIGGYEQDLTRHGVLGQLVAHGDGAHARWGHRGSPGGGVGRSTRRSRSRGPGGRRSTGPGAGSHTMGGHQRSTGRQGHGAQVGQGAAPGVCKGRAMCRCGLR